MQQDRRKPVFKAIDYISQNLHLNPTLDEIASSVALSSFHFHRLFRAQVGETVAAFTRRLRMERAAMWLLTFPQADITGLALRIGFSSSQNFAKAFRAHFAVSPGEFRRRHIPATMSKPGNVALEKKCLFSRHSPRRWPAGGANHPASGAAGGLYAALWPLWQRNLPADASGSAGLIACTNAVATSGDDLCLLGCARNYLGLALPDGRSGRYWQHGKNGQGDCGTNISGRNLRGL